MGELYWDSTYEIVRALMLVYPSIELDNVGLEQLYEMIVALPDFVDDPVLANSHILTDVLREWYEECNP